jgi:hypothetical protein
MGGCRGNFCQLEFLQGSMAHLDLVYCMYEVCDRDRDRDRDSDSG